MFSTEIESTLVRLLKDMKLNYKKMEINKPYDVSNLNYQILTSNGKWNNIKKVIRKQDSEAYILFCDNINIEGSCDHYVKVKNKKNKKIDFLSLEYLLNKYKDFKINFNNKWCDFLIEKTNYKIPIIDFELDGTHSYLSNGIESHNTLFGEKTTTTGGWALPFYASLRLKVSRNGYLKEKIEKNGKTFDEIRGVSAKVIIKKSRIAPPFRECAFNIYFDRGIDDKDSWFEALLNKDVITRPTTQKYLLKINDGREFEFKKNQWKSIVRDNNLDEEIRKMIVDSYIVKYDSFDLDSNDEKFPDDVNIIENDEEKIIEQDVYVEKDE